MRLSSNRHFWSWAGKLALVAVPAAISGFTSYKKAQVAAEVNAKVTYEALKEAVDGLQAELDAQDGKLASMTFKFEALQKQCAPSVPMLKALGSHVPAPAPAVLSPSLELGGRGGYGRQRKPALPERFEDAVERFKAEKK